MNNKNFLKKLGIIALVLGVDMLVYGQTNIDLGNPGQSLAQQLEKWFPWLAAIGFFFAGWKSWDSYQENGKDVMSGLKIMLYYVLILLVFVAVYKFAKSLTL